MPARKRSSVKFLTSTLKLPVIGKRVVRVCTEAGTGIRLSWAGVIASRATLWGALRRKSGEHSRSCSPSQTPCLPGTCWVKAPHRSPNWRVWRGRFNPRRIFFIE